MCGISGTFGQSESGIIDAMNFAMQHRGPDDSGVYVSKHQNAALGHVRLSIIDTSSLGHQPMTYANERYTITFNGEIYNFRELKSELEFRGCKFGSNSDTEVVLAAYAEWGIRCVEKLDGMFAFAILDEHPESNSAPTLFLARDRFGIKPLYYSIQGQKFYFASEIRGLLGADLVDRKIDQNALLHYQIHGSVPQPMTMLRDVKMLQAGNLMSVTKNAEVSIRRYWDISHNYNERAHANANISADEASDNVRELLLQATQRHLVADVPVGAFLSGGIDSSAVVALMNRITNTPIKTFSLGFDSSRGKEDERNWARLVSDHLSTEHEDIIVSGEDVANDYSKIIEAIDQPSVDGTNSFLVSRLVNRQVKVVLSGLGGDELFAGYPHFQKLATLARWDHRLSGFNTTLRKFIVKLLPAHIISDKVQLSLHPSQRLLLLRNLLGYAQLPNIMNKSMDLANIYSDAEKFSGLNIKDDFGDIASTSYFELNHYMANTLLRDLDAMSMHHSLEVRPVLLDYQLAEFVFSLPGHLHFNQKINKPVLSRAVSDMLPNETVTRDKKGFELPLVEWMSGPLRERIIDVFSSRNSSDVFSKAFLAQLRTSVEENKIHGIHPWSALILLEWMDSNHCYV